MANPRSLSVNDIANIESIMIIPPIIAQFEQTAVDYSKIWGKGVLKRMAAALIKENELSKDDIQDLKDYLDELD